MLGMFHSFSLEHIVQGDKKFFTKRIGLLSHTQIQILVKNHGQIYIDVPVRVCMSLRKSNFVIESKRHI